MNVDFLYGILDLNFWQYVLVAVVMVQITIAAVTVYLHRDAAHRSVDLHPALRHFFRFWVWLTTGQVTREWVAVHRKHHAKCETPEDPHSPVVYGLKKVLLEGAELYRDEARKPETLEKYGRGTPNDWVERNVYAKHRNLGITLMVITDLLLFGAPGIIIIAIQMSAMPVLAAGVINGLGHHTGYRNFECPDAATNIVPWGLIVGGEELHNNHHAFPSSAKFSIRPWEFDMGWLWIRLFSMLGLAKVLRVAPTPVTVPDRNQVDLETVRAIIVNRMHVLRAYTTTVVVPTFRQELQAARGTLTRRARRLLVRQPVLLDEAARARLREVLARNQTLRTVHEYRERLQVLWSGANMSNERLLAHLREWIAQAEASGVKALQDFAGQLRGYTMSPS
ncbi:MAG TPA: fatty acid desaturase [Steroidobacteraceae bacterium]|nr:fatty acid desaturase [Steroidobacteraceae bacterium]